MSDGARELPMVPKAPRRGSARLWGMLREAGLVLPLALVAMTLAVALTMVMLHWARPALVWPPLVCFGFLVAGMAGLALTWRRLRSRLLMPLVRLEDSVSRVSQGEPGASEALPDAGVLERMARDIGSLNAELTELYEDMDSRVARQTMRLAQKTASLKILYDVAAGIHQAGSLEDLLLRFLRVLKEMVNGRAATVRLVMGDGSRRLVGSIGLDDDLVREQDMAPVDLCLCGSVLTPGNILCDQDARYCSRIYGRRMFRSEELEVVTVPLEHRDELLGVYTIFVDRPGVSAREDIMDLLLHRRAPSRGGHRQVPFGRGGAAPHHRGGAQRPGPRAPRLPGPDPGQPALPGADAPGRPR
jgi:two-component system, NarL family, nitrate/nitrite sensor histidine kinase NarX